MKKFFAVPALIILFTLSMSLPVAMSATSQEQLKQAENAIIGKDYMPAIEQLKKILEMELETSDLVKANFLMGKAIFDKTFATINMSRTEGKVKMGDISPMEVQELKRSVEYFKAVIDLAPEGKLAPDAYFMLGKLFDYDCLQHFKKSKDYYAAAYEMTPDTQIGTKALECVERIDGYGVHHPKK